MIELYITINGSLLISMSLNESFFVIPASSYPCGDLNLERILEGYHFEELAS
jgi:hypothetical protein